MYDAVCAQQLPDLPWLRISLPGKLLPIVLVQRRWNYTNCQCWLQIYWKSSIFIVKKCKHCIVQSPAGRSCPLHKIGGLALRFRALFVRFRAALSRWVRRILLASNHPIPAPKWSNILGSQLVNLKWPVSNIFWSQLALKKVVVHPKSTDFAAPILQDGHGVLEFLARPWKR